MKYTYFSKKSIKNVKADRHTGRVGLVVARSPADGAVRGSNPTLA